METKVFMILISVLFSTIIALVGYWLKNVHEEFKELIKELTLYTSRMKQLIVGIQMQIEKGIEIDIQELKTETKNLQERTGRLESKVAGLSEKSERRNS